MIEQRTSILSQVQPFNEVRFESALAYLSRKHQHPLSKYEMVKLHLLMDIFHTLDTGNPVIGGNLSAWPAGPVIEEGYERMDEWSTRYDYTGQMPERFAISTGGRLRFFTPTFEPDEGDFSAAELRSMQRAWEVFMPVMDGSQHGYAKSQALFVGDDSFIGHAYNVARRESRDMDWNDLIDAYDEIHGEHHSHIKAMISV